MNEFHDSSDVNGTQTNPKGISYSPEGEAEAARSGKVTKAQNQVQKALAMEIQRLENKTAGQTPTGPLGKRLRWLRRGG